MRFCVQWLLVLGTTLFFATTILAISRTKYGHESFRASNLQLEDANPEVRLHI